MPKIIRYSTVIPGFALFFLVPLAERISDSLGNFASLLVAGYWGLLLGIFVFTVLQNIFQYFELTTALYNLWFCLSFMCLGIGCLALCDDAVGHAPWALPLLIYGSGAFFYKGNEQ